MSQETMVAEKAHWNDQTIDALLVYLRDHYAEGGNNGTFKIGTFNAVSQSIGPPQTGKVFKTKWISVCNILY